MQTKSMFRAKFLGITIVALSLSYLSFDVKACNAAVYLDGSTTSCSNGSTNYNPTTRSCGSGSDKVYLDIAAFSSGMTPGSTNYMRAGSYFRDTGANNVGALHVPSSKSGTSGSPTVIKAYAGEERQVLIGSAKRGATYNSNPSDSTGAGSWNYYPNPSIVTYDASFVTIEGVKTYGQVYLAGGHDVLLQNSDCGGGGGSGTISTDQGNTVRFNNIYNATLRNNKIHHNSRRFEDNNGSLIIGYAFSALLDQNTLTDGYGTYFENKDGSGQAGRTTEVRYNFFGPSTISPVDTVGIRGFNQAQSTSYQYIHHNIFYNKAVGFNVIGSPAIENKIYNNTFINCKTDINQPSNNIAGGQFKSYNNLFYHSGSGQTFLKLYSLSQLTGSDWNIYYNTGNWTTSQGGTQTTLSSFKTYSNMDTASLSTNPNFVNSAGTTAADFKRTSYNENLSGSSYSAHAGAYATGNEVIGFTTTGSTGTKMISAPTGLKITAVLP